MLEALIHESRRCFSLKTALLAGLVAAFTSCASEKQKTALVDDPDAQRASSIPWNKPQNWEGRANFPGNMGGSDPGTGIGY
jgi:hypothetical protein